MKLTSLLFLIHEGFLNIRRNGLMSLAALGTVTVALTVLGGAVWTAYRVTEIAQQQPQKFNTIDVFLNPEGDRQQTLDVQNRIQALSDVRAVHLVSKEAAWAMIRHREPKLTEAMPDNPLMDRLDVEAKEGAYVGRLAKLLHDKSQFPEVMEVTDSNQEIRTLLSFARILKVIGGGAAIGLFIATLFIVQNTIRLTVFARRREIRIMQLVGATAGFIRFPLLMEGVFHGVIGGVLASGLLILGAREVSRFVYELHSPLVGDVPSQLSTLDFISGVIAIGALVGLVGSYLSMRRFLRQP